LKQKTVRFGTDEYFTFVKKNPGTAAWLALGSNVDVVVGDTLFAIRD
jgi:hypothetical protein